MKVKENTKFGVVTRTEVGTLVALALVTTRAYSLWRDLQSLPVLAMVNLPIETQMVGKKLTGFITFS